MHAITFLKSTLPSFSAEYTRARANHAALAPYATPSEVLDALKLSSPLSDDERRAITLALIAEHRQTVSSARSPWLTMLLLAYEPMLRNLRRRILGVEDPEETEQLVLVAFLEALAKVSLDHPPRLLALALRHATERGAFAGAGWCGQPEMVSLEEAAGEVDPCDLVETLEREDQMRAITRELLALFGDEGLARETLDVLLDARTGREPLERFIEERRPDLRPDQRAAEYARLQKMRARALTRLHARFGTKLDDAAESCVA